MIKLKPGQARTEVLKNGRTKTYVKLSQADFDIIDRIYYPLPRQGRQENSRRARINYYDDGSTVYCSNQNMYISIDDNLIIYA
jgi:hypothetical protein